MTLLITLLLVVAVTGNIYFVSARFICCGSIRAPNSSIRDPSPTQCIVKTGEQRDWQIWVPSSDLITNHLSQHRKAPQSRINSKIWDSKIVGGDPTTIQEHPYQVSIICDGNLWCGGSIISPNHILTAAHCTYNLTVNDIMVRIGSTYWRFGGTLHDVIYKWEHDKYSNITLVNDISILLLGGTIDFDDSAQPIALASSEPKKGVWAVVTGWGWLDPENKIIPPNLRMVEVQVISLQYCSKAYGAFSKNIICAGYFKDGKDSCHNDSGGPLVFGGKLVGFVSYGGIRCAVAKLPGVYTNVYRYKEWIEEIVDYDI